MAVNEFTYGGAPEAFAISVYKTYVERGRGEFIRQVLTFEMTHRKSVIRHHPCYPANAEQVLAAQPGHHANRLSNTCPAYDFEKGGLMTRKEIAKFLFWFRSKPSTDTWRIRRGWHPVRGV